MLHAPAMEARVQGCVGQGLDAAMGCAMQELVGMAVALQATGETIGTVVDLYDGTGARSLRL